MCSAVRRRMLSNGMTSSRATRAAAGTPAGAGGAAGAGSGGGRGGRCRRRRGRGCDRRRSGCRSRCGRGRSRGGLVGGVEHVLAGDAPTRAAALDGRHVETAFGHQPAHDRRRERGVAPGVGTGVVGRGGRGRRFGFGLGLGAERERRDRRRRGFGRGCLRDGCGLRCRFRLGLRRHSSGSVAATGSGSAATSGSAAGAAGAVDASASPTMARRVPTSTVSPSGTRISVTTPPVGAGTSESTLSVETSNNGSSAST